MRSRGRDGRILNLARSCLSLLGVVLLVLLRSSVLRLDRLLMLLSGVLWLDVLRLVLSSILGLDVLLLSVNLRLGRDSRLSLGLLHLMLVVGSLVGSTEKAKNVENQSGDDKQPVRDVSMCKAITNLQSC